MCKSTFATVREVVAQVYDLCVAHDVHVGDGAMLASAKLGAMQAGDVVTVLGYSSVQAFGGFYPHGEQSRFALRVFKLSRGKGYVVERVR